MGRFFLLFLSVISLASDLRCSLTAQGLYVTLRDKTIVRRSSIVILSQNQVVYDSARKNLVPQRENNSYVWRDETDIVSLSYMVTNVGEGVEVVFKVRLLKDMPASLQYFLAQIASSLLAGSPFKADNDTGNIPLLCRAKDLQSATLAKDFKTLVFRTSYGNLHIALEGKGISYLLDARLPIWDKQEFWIGYMDVPLPYNQELTFRAYLSFEPLVFKEVVKEATVKISFQDNLASRQGNILIFPPPMNLSWQEGFFPLAHARIARDASPSGARIAHILQEILKENTHLSLPIEEIRGGQDLKGKIVLTQNPLLFQQILSEKGIDLSREPIKPEGYILIVDPSLVLILASDERGLFYGVQTLRWLISKDGIRCCVIKDFPAFPFRGVHFCVDNYSLKFHGELIKNVLAPLKINKLVLECEYAKWNSQPDLANQWSISLEDLKALVRLAKENFMDVYPLIQSFGHAEWAFQKGKNLDIAEDPQKPYAFCPSNPRTYEFLLSIYKEALSTFGNPAIFHIGADEIDMIGRFPNPSCPSGCGQKDLTSLYVQHIHRLKDFLSSQGCQVMIWGDMMLAPGEAQDGAMAKSAQEAQRRRSLLSKDIIIADWHYNAYNDYPSLRIFKNAGFSKIIACTWYRPDNIYKFAQSAYREGIYGLLQTTWSGYWGSELSLTKNFEQVAPYVLSAIYSWNPQSPPPHLLPHRADLFKFLWEKRKNDRMSGYLIDLEGIGDYPLAEIKGGKRTTKGITFLIPSAKILMRSKHPAGLSAPTRLKLKFPHPIRASELLFLHSALGVEPADKEIGQYEVFYEDGSREDIPLSMGNNILPILVDKSTIFLSSPILDDLPGIRIFNWKNPAPSKGITQIQIISYQTNSSILLLGLSAISP